MEAGKLDVIEFPGSNNDSSGLDLTGFVKALQVFNMLNESFYPGKKLKSDGVFLMEK